MLSLPSRCLTARRRPRGAEPPFAALLLGRQTQSHVRPRRLQLTDIGVALSRTTLCRVTGLRQHRLGERCAGQLPSASALRHSERPLPDRLLVAKSAPGLFMTPSATEAWYVAWRFFQWLFQLPPLPVDHYKAC